MRLSEVRKLFPQWMRGFLLLSGVYSIAWGIFVYNFTTAFVGWIKNAPTNETFQVELHGLGLIVLGIIFLITAAYPIRFWYLIVFGFAAKLMGGLWVYFSVMEQEITKTFILHLIINDYVWAIVLGFIAFKSVKLYYLQD
ncbi:MAG: hypothetical protein ACNS62_17575 [Candidatus Cyclobacteriaceae bacterium M3_2C_046]